MTAQLSMAQKTMLTGGKVRPNGMAPANGQTRAPGASKYPAHWREVRAYAFPAICLLHLHGVCRLQQPTHPLQLLADPLVCGVSIGAVVNRVLTRLRVLGPSHMKCSVQAGSCEWNVRHPEACLRTQQQWCPVDWCVPGML